MARTRNTLGRKIDIAHLISAGVLIKACPRQLIDEVLEQTGRASQRRRLLPAPAVVYYVMALALWRELPLEEVLRVVCEGMNWLRLSKGQPAVTGATKSAISQARTRLGAQVMRELAERVLEPVAGPDMREAWFGGLRLMALDGTCLDMPDERANADHFGYPAAPRGSSAFPQLRMAALVECGTHTICAAELGAFSQSERALTESLLPRLRPDQLVLADRGFYSFDLWHKAQAGGARLLWRVSSSQRLDVLERLADGSYMSELFARGDARRRRGSPVRVIEYTLNGVPDAGQGTYRLLTNLSPEQGSAEQLAALYHERWEVESIFGELKTYMADGYSTALRSKTPELVLQEVWGLLLAHFAVRQLIAVAASRERLDPDQISFTNAVNVVKRKLPQAAAIPP